MLGKGGHVTADTLLFEGVEGLALGFLTSDGGGIFRVCRRGSFCGKVDGSRCRSGSKVTFEGRGAGGLGGGGARELGGDGGVEREALAEGRVSAIGEEGRGAALVRAEFVKALVGGRGAS